MIVRFTWLPLVLLLAPIALSADRTTMLVPRAADANAGDANAADANAADANAVDANAGDANSVDANAGDANVGNRALPAGPYADEAIGRHADQGWQAYVRVWKAHAMDPSDRSIRRFLGLPLEDAFAWTAKRGRSAPRYLRWAAGSYAQIDTAHFTIFSRANEADSRLVAEDLERCYWIWTQMFFPLWEGAGFVRSSLSDLDPNQPVASFLKESSARISLRRKLRVVLFRDAEEYQKALAKDYPGIERSTGFYANEKQTIFLYASADDDAATRRHELTHQLFREATRSGLGRSYPGEKEGFWLIEGIAGYCESLYLGDGFATVGGWDSERIQFARYRTLVLGDVMPMTEVVSDGRVEAQQRSDIARWYAHSIAHTHRLLDGGNLDARAWVYQQLAKRYRIASAPKFEGIEETDVLQTAEQQLREFLRVSDDHLRANPVIRPLKKLMLAECQVSKETLAGIAPQSKMTWLDLTRIRVTNDDVKRLVVNPASLEQLRLEATVIDSELSSWLTGTGRLVELDMSWTRVDDSIGEAIKVNPNLDVLYLTGTKVTDQVIDAIVGLTKLKTVDLQRTGVTEAGLSRLRRARPQLEVNPLRLVESQN